MANRRIYQQNHATYSCQYHIVWTTRYRGNILSDKYIKQEFKRIFKQICKWKGFPIHAWHIGDEHIHLYVNENTLSLGTGGKVALAKLQQIAGEKGLI